MTPPQVAADSICSFNNQCLCSWRRRCSPRIPIVTFGMDYCGFSPEYDDLPGWSVLVGLISSLGNNSVFRLHRFRVAMSGRILGRSSDVLELLRDVDYRAKEEIESLQICGVTSTPSPDGRSLFLFSSQIGATDVKVRHRPLQLHLPRDAETERITVSSLPGVPLGRLMRTRPICAAGELWAPCFSEHDGPSRLVMQRLDKDANQWEQVATMNLPHWWSVPAGGPSGRVLHGYVVAGDIILLSLEPVLFIAFNCSTRVWADVITFKTKKSQYIPIHERAIYVEEHDSIYFLSRTVVYAYKLYENQGQYWMDPPTMVDCLCPFSEEGYGFLTHLAGGVMCAVWISVSLRCGCDSRHVLITAFEVIGNKMSNPVQFFPKGFRILHSTCRRLDISPSKPSASNCEFCFLQEYKDVFSMLHMEMYAATTESSVMLNCCREFLDEAPFLTAVTLNGFGIQIRKTLYVICQTASISTVYKVHIIDGVLDCHDKTLTPHCTMATHSRDDSYDMMDRPLAWHFACASKKIYAATHSGNELYMCNLRLGIPMKYELYLSDSKIPSHLSISLILRVGKKVIIISDTFQGVYHVMKCADTSSMELMHIPTHGSVDLERKVNLSGYVVLSEQTFIVFDDDERCPYLLDLRSNQWSSVVTFDGFSSSLQSMGFPCGRSVFIDGFIYTCSDGGLVAYQLTRTGHSFYISKQIYMEFSWQKYWERNRMCLDYVGKNEVSGAIVLCVVQGGDYNSGDCPSGSHPLCITTIQVKIEKTDSGELSSVIHHVDTGTSFVEHEGVIWTRNCVIAGYNAI